MAEHGRRVVVTGLGLVSPLGVTVKRAWSALLAGESGTASLPESVLNTELLRKLPSQVAAMVPRGVEPHQFNEESVPLAERRRTSLSNLYATTAAAEALKDAGLDGRTGDDQLSERFGVAMGLGMIDLEDVHRTGAEFYAKGYSRISPYFIPKILPNTTAGHLAVVHGLRGPNHCVSTACATGLHSIGDAFWFIVRRQADVMLCGAAEASVSPLAIAGFCRLRALSTKFNKSPASASRPFDADRDGFVIGEGAAVLVLEELEHARRRKADIYAEILGYGLSGDAYHITSPDKEGRGALSAMNRALTDAGIPPEHIGYVNAHATSTPTGDEIEAAAVRRLLGGRSSSTFAVSSCKGALGHLLGAAGAVESVFTVLACRHGVLPPTLNHCKPDFPTDLNFVPGQSQAWPAVAERRRRIALKNSFGFGGTNASLCIAQFTD